MPDACLHIIKLYFEELQFSPDRFISRTRDGPPTKPTISLVSLHAKCNTQTSSVIQRV